MKKVAVKIKDLPSFVSSAEFGTFTPKPISELRAISQFNNPDADQDDIALIYLSDENTIIGFVGLLPKKINGTEISVYSNTCWWTDPRKGKGSSLPLFLEMIKITDGHFYVSDTPPNVKTILDKTGLFEPFIEKEGIRGFIRFYFADILKKKYPRLKLLFYPIRIADSILNILLVPWLWMHKKRYKSSTPFIESVSEISDNEEKFIQKHSKNDFIRKSASNLNWIKKYPWVKTATDEPYDYPFTYQVYSYNLDYYILKKNNEISAFFAISNRENLASIPYFYCHENINEAINACLNIVLKKKYDSLVVFHPNIVNYMNKHKMPFYYRKPEKRFSGACKKVATYFNKRPFLQDGDGDVIFT